MSKHLFIKNQGRILLLTAALSGAIIATGRRAVWQDPIESAQVLAGVVNYPTDNPFYIFHVKVWSIINQATALMLYLGLSEMSASLLIGGLVGAISFAGIFLITESVSDNPFISLLTPLLMYSLSLVGASSAYPIALLGSPATYGIIGLSYMLLVIGLLGTGRYKTGAFFTGLAPSVHPGMGTFCVITAILAVLANQRALRPHLPHLVQSFVLGGLVSCASLGWQIYQAPHLPVIDPFLKKAYLEAFIRNMDFHRTAGGWIQPGVLFAILLAILCAIYARQKNVPVGSKIIFSSIILSVVFAFTLVLSADFIPTLAFLKILIPWRFINYANICLIPVSFGILVSDYHKLPTLRSLLFTTILTTCFTIRIIDIPVVNILYLGILLALLSIVILSIRDLPEKPFEMITRLQGSLILAIIALLVFRQVIPGTLALVTGNIQLHDRTNTDIFRTASTRPGVLITAGGMHQIQLVTRRPVLIDGGGLDSFPYIAETGPRFNDILKVYGIDMFVKPRENMHNKGGLTFAHQALWEQRSNEEWQNIRREFGVTDILTPISWNLQLPVVAKEFDIDNKLTPFYWDQIPPKPGKESGLSLYTIPQASKQ